MYEEELDRVLAEVKALLLAKHHDYGVDNLLEEGEYGIVVRVKDKVNRVKTLLEDARMVADEPPMQTWGDVAGYALQAILMRRGVLAQGAARRDANKLVLERAYCRLCPNCGRVLVMYTASVHELDPVAKIGCPGCGVHVEFSPDLWGHPGAVTNLIYTLLRLPTPEKEAAGRSDIKAGS